MQIKLNGNPHDLPGGATVLALTEGLRLNPTQVAVERNRAIVPKSSYASVALSDGDEIEIVTLIGGG